MKQPIKQTEVYQKLRKAIDTGNYPAGSFLPNETAFAKTLGISRNTLRSVFTQLAEEKIIERMYPKGTMVCNRQTKAKPPLSFLLPCSDFISETFPSATAQNSRRLLKGVSQAAFEYNYRVETVTVSPTNNMHDIDWSKLDFVNADSLLIISGYWYRDLFPLLMERGCRVAFSNPQIFLSKQYQDFLKNSFCLTSNIIGATEAAVRHLAAQGCQRIALLHHYIFQQEHPVLNGYLTGLKKCNMTFSAWDEFQKEALTFDIARNQVRDLYKRSGGFDGIIIDSGVVYELRLHNIHQELGLPENVKIMTSDDSENNQRVNPPLSSMAFPYEKIGRLAVQHLISEEFIPEERLINARLIERESTSKLTLT